MSNLTSRKKILVEDIKNELNNLNYEMIDGTYNPKKYSFDCKCPNNHINNVIYYNWKNNINKCNLCRKNKIFLGKLNIDKIKEIFEKEGHTLLSTKYEGYWIPLKYICPKKHETEMSFGIWKNNKYKCRECSMVNYKNNRKLSYDFVKEQFENRKYELLSKEYINAKEKLDFKCDKGHICKITFDDFYYGKSGCLDCGGSKRKTIEDIREYFGKEGYKLLSNEYINARIKLKYECPKGHINFNTYGHFFAGQRCKTCDQSKGENAIKKYLEKMGLKYEMEKKFDDCKNRNKLPFDFFVDDKFLIEYDGSIHFKCTEFFGGEKAFKKRQLHDKIKTDYCKEKGVPLLRISYLEFNNISNCINDFIDRLKTDTKIIHFSNNELYKYLN